MPHAEIENAAKKNGYINILGIDEAGRGPLAGPVVSAALLLDQKYLEGNPLGLQDSKILTFRQRQRLFKNLIYSKSIFGVGFSTHDEIDKFGIVECTKLSMTRAISSCKIKPDLMIVDSIKLEYESTQCVSLDKADSISVSVAGASIIAKVVRDNMMIRIYKYLYPDYFLEANKGYGSKLHIEAIKSCGISRIHRKSFKPISTMTL